MNPLCLESIVIAVPRSEKNPLISQLYSAIKAKHENQKVYWGIDFFWDPEFHSSIYHIHWPEALFDWANPNENDLDDLERILKKKKKLSKFVVNVHNYSPHSDSILNFKRLYQIIYSNADSIIHFGEKSINHVESTYNLTCNHHIIAHPIYDSIFKNISIKDARRQLKISEDSFICLTFGAIRSTKELMLVFRGFHKSKTKNKKLFLVGSKMDFGGLLVNRFRLFCLKHLLAPNHILINRFVSEDEISLYVSAADCLIIPRMNSLNSGNLYLGFTYKKTVIAPNNGVIGEIASKSNNLLFDPLVPETLGHAIDKAFERKTNPHLAQNNNLESKTSADVAQLYMNLYKSILTN